MANINGGSLASAGPGNILLTQLHRAKELLRPLFIECRIPRNLCPIWRRHFRQWTQPARCMGLGGCFQVKIISRGERRNKFSCSRMFHDVIEAWLLHTMLWLRLSQCCLKSAFTHDSWPADHESHKSDPKYRSDWFFALFAREHYSVCCWGSHGNL